MNRKQKESLVADLHQAFSGASMVLVTRNSGLSVAQATQLRNDVRNAGGKYKVAKNRLVARAVEGTEYADLLPMFTGPTAIAWSDEPVEVTKAIVDFAKKNEKLEVAGASFDGQILDAQAVNTLASLPSLDELRARFIRLIQTPATRIASVTQAPASKLARVFDAYSKSGEAA